MTPPTNKASGVEESAGSMYKRLGIDGRLWAEEMSKRFNIPVDELLPWTCSMCMAGYDRRDAEVRGALV